MGANVCAGFPRRCCSPCDNGSMGRAGSSGHFASPGNGSFLHPMEVPVGAGTPESIEQASCMDKNRPLIAVPDSVLRKYAFQAIALDDIGSHVERTEIANCHCRRN